MDNNKIKETVTVRGICESIQAMAMPTFENLTSLLKKFGYTLTKDQ